MAHWGVAYAAGPNYNFPWELQDPAGKAAALARAYDSTRAALALVARVSAPECALIEALPARYPRRDPIDDQRPWNDAFADAMRLAHKAHPDDLDLRFSFAEAILNRTPFSGSRRLRSSRFRTTTSYCGRGSRYPVISESYRGSEHALPDPKNCMVAARANVDFHKYWQPSFIVVCC